ncbi:uracil-DNA glycosylase, mitochondrial-like [Hibiscus syriacus]|uniref:uracil-DNA glycosylase, mitochondrial-like n=1 Tax=Hibiscus syriacus TaxID=106335 RepID=UPI001920592D|nr:uracil-DNA glycosylase, mitochondrial-like [Hibiscus syriacus]
MAHKDQQREWLLAEVSFVTMMVLGSRVFSKAVVETDCKEALSALKSDANGRFGSPMAPHIVELVRRDWRMRFVFVPHECNRDPYHGPGQAMGLSFSVPEGVKIPSSLVNIFKELKQDLGCSIPSHGNPEKWAVQGVLLLNTVLPVRKHQANSHAKKGWEVFTDAVIKTISQKKEGVVFLLWENSAQEKLKLIDQTKHHILKAAHPSGLSANRGCFGCRHFSPTNQLLEQMGTDPIDWQL